MKEKQMLLHETEEFQKLCEALGFDKEVDEDNELVELRNKPSWWRRLFGWKGRVLARAED